MSLKGNVFSGKDGNLFMICCPKCERENWAMSVASGECCWCGYKATKEDVNAKLS